MLEHLKLTRVGPAPVMELELAPRLNFFTGDNGLGKSFLLDIAWWSLTRTWARSMAVPQRPFKGGVKPTIQFRYGGITAPYEYVSTFNRQEQSWPVKQGRPPIPGLVIYAQLDGGFSAWDPARNYWK